MNDTIRMQLDEVMFDRNNQDLISEYSLGRKITNATGIQPVRDKVYNSSYPNKAIDRAAYNDEENPALFVPMGNEINRKHDKAKSRADLATAAVGGAYVGGALLLYKGIKALYKKYKTAKTPEAKAAIKSQISDKKAKLKKEKAKKG